MSRSVNELLKSLQRGVGKTPGNGKDVEHVDIYNPDVPEPERYHNVANKDQYYRVMKMPSQPRNGTFAMSQPRTARNTRFMADGDIDPNVIRKKVDPDHALPNLNSRTLFKVPDSSLRKSHNQIDMLKRSRTTELNWANRFNPNLPK